MRDDEEPAAALVESAAYVLQGEYACHECGCIVPVFAVMLVGPFQGESALPLDADDDSAVIRRAQELPLELATAMTQTSQGNYRPDFSKTISETYWMNHC